MLVIFVLLLATVCFGARFFVNDGRLTASGGLLLVLAIVLSNQSEVLTR